MAQLEAGNILDEAIVFIEDTKEIWNHGTYFDGSTFDPTDIEASIQNILDTKADKSDVEVEIEVPNGVYAVTAEGKLVTYDDADETCIAVALIVNDAPTPQRLMIEKNGEANTTSIKAAYDADGATNTAYTYFYWGMYGSDQSGIPTYNQVGGNSSSWSWGYLPQANGSYYSSSNNLSSDITTWTDGTALGDFNGKANTATLLSASDTDSYTEYANMGTWCRIFNQTETENQGYTDWYIPACGQLALMYLNMTAINNALTKIGGQTIASDEYWSSSEYGSNYGLNVGFDHGDVGNLRKSYNGQVRFVRNFTPIKSLKERVSEIESNKADKTEIPTKVSQLENDVSYVSSNSSIKDIQIVSALPSSPDSQTLYLIPE